jgi:NAD(P)-dependent dehydrogenase (short-subunit alcohol dehydrogenase family)
MRKLAGKVAVITGGRGDIGRVSTNLRAGNDAAG